MIFMKIYSIFYKIKKEIWLLFQRSRLSNNDFTIIANNCIGGIIYHDMKKKFLSPTINLDIPPRDFIVFCNHLKYYLSLEIQEIQSTENCPVGIIHGEFGDVRINFRHYKSFDEALCKWNERLMRINWENIFIIMESQVDDAYIMQKFNKIPWNNRVLFSIYTGSNMITMPYEFYHVDYYWGKILDCPNNNIHRYLEALDYVSFFNKGKVMQRNLNLFN